MKTASNMFFLNNNRKNRSGQFLVEGLVALSILTIVILGVVVILSRSFKQTRIMFETTIAANLAAEGAEIAKNIIDRNVWAGKPWNSGIPLGYCSVSYNSGIANNPNFGSSHNSFIRFDPQNGIYSYEGTVETPFKRNVLISTVNPNLIKIISTVVIWKTSGVQGRKVFVEHNVLGWR